jgi:regulator of RNase E activity RraB
MKLLTLILPAILFMSFSQFFGFAKKPDPDQLVIEQLRKAGSDVSKPHKIEFFLYFPTKSSATEVASTIRKLWFGVDVAPAAQGTQWLCSATKTMIPELPALQKIRREFTALADTKGGEYDGWGTGIVN